MARLALALVALLLAARTTAAPGAMVPVPAGPFWMGRDGGPPEEAPEHRVNLAAFWIDRHQVTNAAFAEFLNARGWVSAERERRYDWEDADARIHQVPLGMPGHPREGQPTRWVVDPGFELHPAVEVTWFGARDYCAWRGRRLPTEAEWEKAARGDDRRPFPWGWASPAPDLAVFGRRYNATEPVDARPRGRSPWGVEGLLGNLREWTATLLRPYPYRPDDGREGQHPGAGRVVVRGASHDDPADSLSATRRRYYDHRGAAAGHHHVGFRCATSEDPGGR